MKRLKLLVTCALLSTATSAVYAQRPTDKLDRGLVAVPVGSGNFVSWRIFGEEYYDTEYNLYRGGTKLNAQPLKVSNFQDTGGNSSSEYQVEAIVRGKSQGKSAAVRSWNNAYFDIVVKPVVDRNGTDVTSKYILNDVSLADVDGDGVSEFIVKRNNSTDLKVLSNKTAYNMLECYNIKGERLWYIDLGPNMMSGADEQFDIVGYDWDGDGNAEMLMRGQDNMIIHTASGKTIKIGDMNVDTRWDGMEYTSTGNEYLLYLNGATGDPYQIGPSAHPNYMDYPLTRGLDSDWGSGIVGHRSTKHFFGAPFLDGRHASIFLGRGIYTKHKMAAFDVDPATHKLTQRWYWTSDGLDGSWFGNGYHNYAIADVDWDGRDEIVYGSMVIDDNGKGLSTTGLGHGDAQHCSDLDPYRHGQEQFACNETQPAVNYRDATTSKIYYRLASQSDDGRALAGNFTNQYPGSVGRSTQSGMISSVADKPITELGDFIAWNDLNFRIYWDGDLCEEVLNSPGTEREAVVLKPGKGRIFQSNGCKMNNWTKNNPGATGDILGDWREEIVLRTGDNAALRIYTTTEPTAFRNYTLWHDHQYRQAMVWQSLGYNQPPHTSYFLGEMEGITIAPPPLTMTGRTEIKNGGSISTANKDQHVMVCYTGNSEITVADGANPYIATFNIPSWVQGSNNNNGIKYEYYTCNVTGGAFTGDMRLVKQGDGILNLPKVEQTYTGNTDVWAGTLNFDGKLLKSSLWLNRFAELNSNGGEFKRIKMDYASKLRPGGKDNKGTLTTDSLALGFGARVILDIYNDGLSSDVVKAKVLTIEKKDWNYGPKYLTPVLEINAHKGTDTKIAEGKYLIGEIAKIDGDIKDIKIEGASTAQKVVLEYENGKLYLVVAGLRDAAEITWNGNESNVWDFATTSNFNLKNDVTASESFTTHDKVTFDDTAANFDVVLNGELEADTITVDAQKAYTFGGNGSIIGNSTLIKKGSGTLTIKTDNSYKGGTRISGGVLSVSSIANATQALGNMGAVSTIASRTIIENGAELRTTAAVTQGSPMQINTDEGGVIRNYNDFIVNKPISGTVLTKNGGGWMKLNTNNTALRRLVIAGGTVQNVACSTPAQTVEFVDGTINEGTSTSYPIFVPEGGKGTWNLIDRGAFNNTITGSGTLTIYCPVVELSKTSFATRTQINGNWSAFEGTIVATAHATDHRFTLNNSYGLPKGTLEIPSGVIVQNSARTFRIGKLSGTGSLGGVCSFSQSGVSGMNTWQVGNDEDFVWAGKITGNANFAKVGKGTMTVSNKYDHTGITSISEGALRITSSAGLGNGVLTVAKDAKLIGVNTLSSVLTNSSVAVSGTVQAGTSETSTTGTIYFNDKNVSFYKGSFYIVGVKKGAGSILNGCSSLSGINRLTMNGTIKVFLADNYDLHAGDSVRIWSAKLFTGTPVFELPELNDGLTWDTSRIADGLLFVTVNTGIDATINGGAPYDVYDVKGNLIRKQVNHINDLGHGTYILRQGKKSKKIIK